MIPPEYSTLLEHFTLQTPKEAAKALVDLIDGATHEKDGGEFVDMDGNTIPWL